MIQEDTWFESGDGAKLYVRRWLPNSSAAAASSATQPLAVLHIVHGMAEHGGRYGRLAAKLCEAGIEVWAADQRGHGKTANLSVNDPGKGGILGHCVDKGTYERVTADIDGIIRKIRETRPGIPLFLLGHSWGSFIVQSYIESKNNVMAIDGCILSGTRGPGGLKMKAGAPFIAFLALIFGKRRGSPLVRSIVDGPYNRPFRPNRTAFDWISRDEAEVDAYNSDPCSGNLCSTGFYRDLVRGLCQIHEPEAMARIRQDLPVYIFCGGADPVGEMGASPTALVNAYYSLGMKDLEFVLYPGARHETLNDTNRNEVMENLLSWICRHINPRQTAERE
ncbi:MAG: lysophospholipase [Treponema sp.]|jgi:alpha-beta hydrolase superfamily lysophospholipase|nr:lysophospholipase [Treponema sp.]